MIDPETIAAAASVRLNVPAADLLESANAALVYIAADISTTIDTLDDTDALLMTGARNMCELIYQDVAARRGELDPFGTASMSGLVIPQDLGTHLRHYWTHAQHRWGVA
ncbi:MAG: hypothetical protein ABWZ99_16315 [Ilumatobacteraceae bacterium]